MVPFYTGFTVAFKNGPGHKILVRIELSSNKGSGKHVQISRLAKPLLLTYTNMDVNEDLD